MDAGCDLHPFEHAHDECRVCRKPFCRECLVYSFGPKQPPLCVPCALGMAGVRRSGRRQRANI